MPQLRRSLASLLSSLLCAGACQASGAGAVLSQSAGPASPGPAEAEVGSAIERYAQAWYEGNAAQMSDVLHPEFRHLGVRHAPRQPDAVEASSGLAWLDRTDRGLGRNTAPAQRRSELQSLQVLDGVASAQLQLADHREQLTLVRWNNRWRVLQAVEEQGGTR